MSEPQEPPGITTGQVRGEALACVTGWIGGWTEPDAQGVQRRIRLEGYGDDYVDVLVEEVPLTGEPERRSRITVIVTEPETGAGS